MTGESGSALGLLRLWSTVTDTTRSVWWQYRYQSYLAVSLTLVIATGSVFLIVGTLVWGGLLCAACGFLFARAAAERGQWRHHFLAAASRVSLIIGLAVGVAKRPSPLLVLALLCLLLLVTARLRSKGQTLLWLRTGVAEVLRVPVSQIRIRDRVWQGAELQSGRLLYPGDLRDSDPGRREAVEEAIRWRLRASGDYGCDFLPSQAVVTFVRVPELPALLVDREWEGTGLDGGVVIGETYDSEADAVSSDGVPVRLWRPDTHLLIAGATRGGKTVLMRGLAVRGLASGQYGGGLWLLDGKGAGDYASLDGRVGVHMVAHTPAEWSAGLAQVLQFVRTRYQETLQWRRGQGDAPRHPRVLVLIDEVQMLMAALDKEARAALDEIARTSLAANVTLVIGTQRPDAKDAVPGAIRDNIVDRIVVGRLSRDGAQMMLPDGLWQSVVSVDHSASGTRMPPGRAYVWIDGNFSPVQVPWLPQPSDDEDYAVLYPPLVTPVSDKDRG